MTIVATVLAFNAARTIERVLDAVADQTVHPSRIIVVDNASTDETVALARRRGGVDVFEMGHNRGVGAGHNFAITSALEDVHCSFVWVLEHDTFPLEVCLSGLVERAVECPDAGIITPYLARSQNELNAYLAARNPSRLPGFLVDSSEIDQRFTFNGILVRRNCYAEIGPIREDFFVGQEDWDYSHRLSRSRWLVAHAPDACALHPNKGMRRMGTAPTLLRDYYSSRNSDRIAWEHAGLGRLLVLAKGAVASAMRLRRGRHRTLIRALATYHAARNRMGEAPSSLVKRISGIGNDY